MPILTPSATVVLVFLITSWALGLSVYRDLAGVAQLKEWRQHVEEFFREPGHPSETLIQDVNLSLSILLRSELTVFLLVQWAFTALSAFALLTVTLFLGQLSTREISRLSERLVKFIVFKVVFCGALIIPDIYEIALWLAWFAMVGFMRIFMGAAKDRLESLVVSPSATTWAHLRTLALVIIILVHDAVGMALLLSSLGSMQMTKVLLCAFDMAIVLVEGMKTLLRYAVHLWDQHIASQHDSLAADAPDSSDRPHGESVGLGWEAWEGKGALLYHTELVADVLVHAMTLAHYLHVWFLHGLSFQLIDAILFLDIRSILLSMLKRIRSYVNYRNATHSLRHAFPDAALTDTREVCSICMDRMNSAKQLPCGHLFHLACLRAWLQQSGTESFACPLCRTPLLRENVQRQRQQQPRRRRPWLWAAASRMVSAMYLDILVGLLLGLPSTATTLHRRAVAAAVATAARNQEMEARLRQTGDTSVRNEEHPLERVGENEQPALGLRATAGPPRGSRRRWMDLLLRRGSWRAAGTAPAVQVQQQEVQAELDDCESDEDLHDVAAEDDSLRGWLPHARARRASWRQGARSELSPRRSQEGHAEAMSDAAAAATAAAAPVVQWPPLMPPPYPEPSTWSAGSLQAAAQHVAHSIRSSWGMGERGYGAVAGHEHGTDQEAESPFQPRPRRRARPQPCCPGVCSEQIPEDVAVPPEAGVSGREINGVSCKDVQGAAELPQQQQRGRREGDNAAGEGPSRLYRTQARSSISGSARELRRRDPS